MRGGLIPGIEAENGSVNAREIGKESVRGIRLNRRGSGRRVLGMLRGHHDMMTRATDGGLSRVTGIPRGSRRGDA